MNMKNLFAAAAVASVASVTAVSAATVDVNVVFGLTLEQARADQAAFMAGGAGVTIVEDFESYAAGTTTTPIDSKVGQIVALGGGAAGSSATAPLNEGIIRTGNVAGRFNTTVGGANFLDSNDVRELRITMPGTSFPLFDRVSFLITDADDTAAFNFAVSAFDGEMMDTVQNFVQKANGNIALVTIDFGKLVGGSIISMFNNTTSGGPEQDGWGVDDIAVSAVPVPAAGLLLIAGLGGLAALKRRKSS